MNKKIKERRMRIRAMMYKFSINEMALLEDVSESTVIRDLAVLRKEGESTRREYDKKLRQEKAWQLLLEGLSVEQIAEELSLAPATIYRYFGQSQ